MKVMDTHMTRRQNNHKKKHQLTKMNVMDTPMKAMDTHMKAMDTRMKAMDTHMKLSTIAKKQMATLTMPTRLSHLPRLIQGVTHCSILCGFEPLLPLG